MDTSAVRTLPASKPGCTARRWRKLFMSKPAEMSNTSANAISATTNASRNVFTCGGVGIAASAGAQRIRKTAAGNLRSRGHSENNPAQQRNGGSETKDSEIHPDIVQFWNHLRSDCFEDKDSRECQQHTGRAAQCAQQQTFGEHLADETAAPGAYRRAPRRNPDACAPIGVRSRSSLPARSRCWCFSRPIARRWFPVRI
jgi:hypothetical protein